MTRVLGIDVGGTETVCLLGTGDGAIVASARGPGANLQAVGELELEKVLHAVMASVLREGPAGAAPAAICLGIAGVDRPEDATVVRGILDRIGATTRTLVVNDALIALQAAIDGDPGVVVIAGTGSIAYGRDRGGLAARAGGWGYVLGDEGSSYWIGRMALRAVLREFDGRGETTALTARALAHFGVERVTDLVHAVYQHDMRPSTVAALAIYVQQASDEGDRIATSILDRSADELVAAAAAVTARLELAEQEFAFVLAGGAFHVLPGLAARVAGRLPSLAPCSRTIHLQAEPALGAVRLALEELRGGARLPTYKG
jgi:N-acetylglucosamine kinase-like BadF-type ATPase